jgi:hypothetical protein
LILGCGAGDGVYISYAPDVFGLVAARRMFKLPRQIMRIKMIDLFMVINYLLL